MVTTDDDAAETVTLGPRFEQALLYATHIHAGQRRKGSHGEAGAPYIGHLLGVASLVIDDGGDEDEVIGSLLHDAAEDQGGLERLKDISIRFGERVAEIVDACSDTYESPKPPWRQRKEAYISRIAREDAEQLRVSLADKLHNARAIVSDVRSLGAVVWARFNGKKSGTLWYYRTLSALFARRLPRSPLSAELVLVVKDMEELARAEG